MKTHATFYHAGCHVCIAAEQSLAQALDPSRFEVRIIHLGQTPSELAGAERAGVQSVPALVLNGQVFHINFGAALSALK
ncbi:MAG: thioredoxin family protein [Verrucomicrobia bacterium]|nr:thioredoxin family protein [Verrucomicrobiota bacterium]